MLNPANERKWVQERNQLNTVSRTKNMYLTENKRYKWRFNVIDNNPEYPEIRCKLKSGRCIYETNHGRCKRRTVIPFGLCWQHALYKANLRIGRTKLTDSRGRRLNFLGLFACDMKQSPVPRDQKKKSIVFKRGQKITSFMGEVFDNMKQIHERYPGDITAPYTFQTTDSACVRGLGSLSNACTRGQNATCNNLTGNSRKNNAKLKSSPKNYGFIEATGTIRNGDEILTSYGSEYWPGIHLTEETIPKPNINYKCPRK